MRRLLLAIGLIIVLAVLFMLLTAYRPDRVDEHYLPDGTQCAVYRESISCNWQNNISPTAELPPYARVEIREGKLAWSLTP